MLIINIIRCIILFNYFCCFSPYYFNRIQIKKIDNEYKINKLDQEKLLIIKNNSDQLEHIQLEKIKQNIKSFLHIENPTEKVQLEVVKYDGSYIKYICTPSERVQFEAIKSIIFNILYISNPSEKVQIEAVKQNSNSIAYIENPSKKFY